MDRMDRIRIGIWVPEKKKAKMQLAKFEQLCRNRGIEVIFLDLGIPLEDQGPFDVILHKLSDELTVSADSGDPKALSDLNNFQSYVSCHPEVPVVDPLERTQPLRDRRVMFHLLTKACQNMPCATDKSQVFVPSFVELSSGSTSSEWFDLMKSTRVQFPVVCKPSDAGIPETAHDMSLVFNVEGLKEVSPPCVAQTFINHDGLLYKLFVFGDKHFITCRPSLKNVLTGDFYTEHFTTNDVSKPDSESHLIHKTTTKSRESSLVRINNDVMKCIAQEVRRTLEIDLMGIDVIISSATGHYAIIDVNPFPGFNGIPEIHEKLLEFLKGKASKNKS